MIVKSKSLSGFDAPYVPGWDCHGMPIEVQIEKEHGKTLSVEEVQRKSRRLRSRGRSSARKWISSAWACSASGTKPLQDDGFQNEADEIRALGRLIARGYVYRGLKPGELVFRLRLGAREAEVEYMDRKDVAIDVGFAFAEPPSWRRHSAWTACRRRGLDRDLDDDAVDDTRQSGAQCSSAVQLRPGQHRTRAAHTRE